MRPKSGRDSLIFTRASPDRVDVNVSFDDIQARQVTEVRTKTRTWTKIEPRTSWEYCHTRQKTSFQRTGFQFTCDGGAVLGHTTLVTFAEPRLSSFYGWKMTMNVDEVYIQY